ncbi:phage antirepressor N-terminal domain-containing protein [Serratia fonticola]|uniref:phage antirepressor N-terminal domain-containing protein n=1 Tax=Serratia fonticola TaxID=47917 RepID=UPI001F1867E7|nr:phage antirepressor N-terminal domain-containing protein [Serratia fonticola]
MAHLAISVSFHGSILYIIKHYGKPYIPMKPVVEGMGMDWQRQRAKLKGQFNTHIEKFTIKLSVDSQPSTFVCLALDIFSDWMQTLCPNKVNPQIRDKVIQYQCECYDLLLEGWAKGESRQMPHSTTEERTPLQTAVNRIANKYGLPYQAIYKLIHRQFGTQHLGELTERQNSEAIGYLLAKVIDGELLGKQEVSSSLPTLKQFTDEELCDLAWLWRAGTIMIEAVREIYPLLRVAEHRLAGRYFSIGQEYARTLNKGREILKRETVHIEHQPWQDNSWTRLLPYLRREV